MYDVILFLKFSRVMLYFVTIFLSAFLLFLVQPMIAKVILPDFGGGASVWTICMLFFQALLLGGYLYAHGLIKWLKPRSQLIVHACLLLLAVTFTPIAVNTLSISYSPQMTILATLLISIGLPYFVLSSNAPLIQRWFAYDKPKTSPYKLYALSNIGSLIGLVAYPFIIEPFITLESQLLVWSVAYWCFVGCSLALIAMLVVKLRELGKSSKDHQSTQYTVTVIPWIGLSALGVVALLAVTNSMTQNISAIPFLWLLPLSLYLISFIICFGRERFANRQVWLGVTALSLPIGILLFFFASMFSIVAQLFLYGFILLAVCMLCHGELVRMKPDSSRLTLYYLAMSVGGVIGGLFVNFIAPWLFDQFIEFPLVIWLTLTTLVVLTIVRGNKSHALTRFGLPIYLIAAAVGFVLLNNLFQQYDVVAERNFYGQLAVKDVTVNGFNERRLVDGTTSHGTQSLNPANRDEPLSYYRRGTGVEAALSTLQQKGPINAVIIGLGAGTLTAYGNKADSFTFFELNPLVKDYANRYFTYLSSSKAEVKVNVGDGRQLLSRYGENDIDLLVVDAFSSDAIPVHLLTREAVALYANSINDHGIVALHISNSHLDLVPLVFGLAEEANLASAFAVTDATKSSDNTAQWVLLAKNGDVLQQPTIKKISSPWPSNTSQPVIWTDDYSNLLSVLK